MTRSVILGHRQVGPGHPCVVIAEIGVNHNGSLSMARDLVVVARRAGADYAKFQTFRAGDLVTRDAAKAPYQQSLTAAGESQYEMLKRLELTQENFRELRAFCAEQRIGFLSTPYSEDDARFLVEIGVDAIKIPSALIVEPGLLRSVARLGRPLVISTGMATLPEVAEAVEAVRSVENAGFILLQCTTEYPTDPEHANVRVLETLARTFHVPVGFSDHTRSMTAAITAVALGASVIEKHLTLDNHLPGPDHAASADPVAFGALVAAVRETEAVLGIPDKVPTEWERTNAQAMRRSVVARRAILSGEVVDIGMLAVKRPSTGIPPRDLPRLVGTRARVAIEPDQPLEWWMID